MDTTTKMTFAAFQNLAEREGVLYELDEGELLMEPSPSLLHNRIRDRIARRLAEFVEAHQLGEVTVESDFRLGPDSVRNPDVAFIAAGHLQKIDPAHSPIEGAPALAIEVISPSNLAQDTQKKVSQHLGAGSQAVWIVYPPLRRLEIHQPESIRQLSAPEALQESDLFPGLKFFLPLAEIFSD